VKQADSLAESSQLHRIRELIQRGECVLFLGAGVSVDSGAPSGDELARELVDMFLTTEQQGYRLDEVCQLVEANFGREALSKRISGRFQQLSACDPLTRIPEFRWKSIYTVNFDTLLEQAYADNDARVQNLRVFYTDEEPPGDLGPDDVPLYKLHGCMTCLHADLGQPILTKRDYARAQRIRRNLYHRLFQDGSDLTILYVGFSRRDPDFYQVLVDIADSAGDTGEIPWSYAVQPEFDDYEYERWHQERVTLIKATASEFFEVVA
jgi:hypothetical protein